MWSAAQLSTWLLAAAGLGPSPAPEVMNQAQAILEQPIPHGALGSVSPGSPEAWTLAIDRAERLVANMTLDEKLNITSGRLGPCQANSGSVPRLGIPSFCYNDGPAGLRMNDFVTQYPSQFTAVMAWDRDLMWELEERIGGEFAGKGVNVELGPLTGGPLGRSPFGGRNWEAFTPDPYLSSQMSYIAIRATQSTGLIACAKHYFLYEQAPVCTGPLDDYGGPTECRDVISMVDDKTIKELYLPSFAEAIRAGVGAIMCSYNQINDTATCQNEEALTRILRDELNFNGYVLSDFGATHSTVESANAGMDQELPGTYYYGDKLGKAVKTKKVSKKRLDEMVTRVLTPWIALGQADGWKEPSYYAYNMADEVKVGHHVFRNLHVDPRKDDANDFARRVAEESHVLLKNEGLLPFSSDIRRIGVFGTDADYPTTIAGCGYDLFCLEGKRGARHWNGTVTVGGGSGATYATYIVPPIEALSIRGRAHGLRIDHVLRDDKEHYEQMTRVAQSVQICLVAVSVFLVEGVDRETLLLDNKGEQLILHVAQHCAGDVVVVIHAGGPVIVESWIDHPKIKSVIFAGYPGQESGNALVNILFGDVNPSGKLAFTLGKKEKDWPTNNILRKKTKHPRMYFSERLAIDYKWFDQHSISPRYEFGHGLSYTTFEISNLEVSERYEAVKDTIRATNEKHDGEHDLYDTLYVARVKVTNTGKKGGKEVAQLYMTYPPSEGDQPPKHLRGFEKVYLEPGESKDVEFPLRKKDLSVWDVKRQTWTIPNGTFTFRAGPSSRDLVTKVDIDIGK